MHYKFNWHATNSTICWHLIKVNWRC